MDIVVLVRDGMAQYGLDGSADIVDVDLEHEGLLNTLGAFRIHHKNGSGTYFEGKGDLLTLSREQRIRRVENFFHHPTSAVKALEVLTMLFFSRKARDWREQNGGRRDPWAARYGAAQVALSGMTAQMVRIPRASAESVIRALERHGMLRGSRQHALRVVEAVMFREHQHERMV